MGVSLQSLPTELLSDIVQHLGANATAATTNPDDATRYIAMADAKRNLSHLCLVSRQSLLVAQPVLYESIEVSSFTYYPASSRGLSNTRTLLRTLMERPELALHVQHLLISAWKTIIHPQDMEVRHLFATTTQSLQSLSWYDFLKGNFYKGYPDAELTLLLALLPNIKFLFFTSLPDDYDNCLDHAMKLILSHPGPMRHRFTKLEQVIAIRDPHKRRFHPFMFSRAFRLPGLRSITLNGTCDERGHSWDCPPGQSAVRHLDLSESDLSPALMADIINSCKHLETLKIRNCLDYERADIQQVLADLSLNHSETLQKLAIDTQYGTRELPRPSSFRNFHALRFLCIEERVLLGRSLEWVWNGEPGIPSETIAEMKTIITQLSPSTLLPDSLETLVLLHCSWYILLILESLLDSPLATTKLRSIRVLTMLNQSRFAEAQKLDALKARFVERGIELKFDPRHFVDWIHVDVFSLE